MRQFATYSFEISRKILCLLLARTLLIQTGCQTMKVLQSLGQEDLKAKNQQSMNF